MAKNNERNYYEMFVGLVSHCCEAAKFLDESLNEFDYEKLSQKMEHIHAIEHGADGKKHEMMSLLVKEFITPIEREDIISIGNEIDSVTDSIEDVVLKIYMYNVRSIRPYALEFSKIIMRCCGALKTAMQEFHNFKKSEILHNQIVEINRLEEEGDKLYIVAVRELYTNSKDPVEIMAWTEVFEVMEKCCDTCEHVANVMESVIMKNT